MYDERDRADHDPRDGLMRDLDLPRGEERELVVGAPFTAVHAERVSDRRRQGTIQAHPQTSRPVATRSRFQ